jgi:DNA-binding NarL/FixJ family response regulator
MNILIVEDHKSFKEGIELYLAQFPDYKVWSAENGKQALSILNGSEKINLIISDLNLPEMNGFEMIETARKRFPEVKIIVLTMYYNKNIVRKLKELDVNGFLTKNISLSEISLAIEKINDDKCYITREIISLFQDHEFSTFQEDSLTNFSKTFSLSPRELDILDLMIENKTNQEIADLAFISTETVKSHRKNIYKKLGVNNVLDLYKLLLANKYIKL